jgi:high-affinity iron transporter
LLPTFVIGLREGLEAALIVGIIAAFLRKQGRRDLLGYVLVGVTVAVLLCLGAGIALHVYSQDLPQRQQEGLETVIGALAVGMVTYMVIWMRRHSRELKGQLEGMAANAMSGGSGGAKAARAMVAMAFLAVIREGLETVVFLLAAFNETGSGSSAGVGALLGIAVAIALGYGIYRGGVRLNLSKFFRATGLVLVLVAAGLVVNALHTAHEANWLNAGQGSTVDLSWLVRPGSVQASLLTGMLGIQTHPVVIELVGWLVYLVPVGCYVAWPPGRPVPTRALVRGFGVGTAVAAVAAIVLALVAPGRPASRPVTSAGGMSAQVVSRSAEQAVVRTRAQQPIDHKQGTERDITLIAVGSQRHAGVTTEAYRASLTGSAATGRPESLDTATVARLNGGRLPIGILPTAGRIPATYADALTVTAWLDTRTDRVIDLSWTERLTATAHTGGRSYPLTGALAQGTAALPQPAARAAASAAVDAHSQLDRRTLMRSIAAWFTVLGVLSLLAAGAFALAGRRRTETAAVATPREALVRS